MESRTIPRVAVIGSLVVVLVLTIGLSVVGLRSFYGADILESFAPWNEAPPDGVVPTNPLVGDTVDTIMPQKAVMRSLLGSGLPTWNALQFGGTPFAAIRNAGVMSVLNIPFWVLPMWYAPGVAQALELAVAIGFTMLFLRLHGLRYSSALLGGFFFAFSGFQVAWNNWHQTHVGALLAALFWSIEIVLVKRRAVWGLPLVAVLATMWFEGFPSVTGYGLFFGGIYALVRVVGIERLRTKVVTLSILAGGVVVGTAVAAIQLIPFSSLLASRDLSERAQQSGIHLPIRTIATIFVPNAFGSPVDRNYFGPLNYIEIQSFLGIVTIVLAIFAVVYGWSVIEKGVLGYFIGAMVLCGLLLWLGGPILGLLQETPLFGLNFVGRLRSVLGFVVAVVAAVGFEAILRGIPARASNRHRVGFGVLVAVVFGGAALTLSKAWEMATASLETAYLGRLLLVAAGVFMVVAVIAVLVHTRRTRLRIAGLVAIPIVFAAEVAMFAVPFWPQIPVDEFYPLTEAHVFVRAGIGDERIAAAGLAFYPSTTMFYGIKSVTGHGFHDPEWQEMLETVDPDVMRASPTFSIFASTPAIGSSPILDRLAARYFAMDPRIPIAGPRETAVDDVSAVEISPGFVATLPIAGAVRGIEITLPDGFDPGTDADMFVVDVLDAGGESLATGSRRVDDPLPAGSVQVPAPEVQGTAAIELRYVGDTPVVVGADGDGAIAYDVIGTTDDGLRLAFGGTANVFERTTVLERVRWAPHAVTIADTEARLAALAAGVAADTVVLSDPGSRGSGAAGTVDIRRDDGSAIDIDVSAEGEGYVVVSESLQRDWIATLDDAPVPVVAADHAVGAVLVPAGDHRLELRYRAPGLIPATIVSLGAVLLSCAVLGVAIVRRSSSRRAAARTTGEPDGQR